MTTPGQMIQEYSKKPFSLSELKGKEFTILENISKTSQLREKTETSDKRQGFKYKVFFIHIECGLFHKDLKLFETEVQILFLAIPDTVQNYAGSIISVDKFESRTLKYTGMTTQDINGNRIGGNVQAPGQNAPITQNQAIPTQTSGLDKLVADMKYLNSVGTEITSAILMKMCDSIQPGRALDMIKAAKDAGYIFEQNGVFKPVV